MSAANEKSPSKPQEKKKSVRVNRKSYFLLGLTVIIMSVIGVISTISFVFREIGDLINQTDRKNEFASFIYPLVLCDPPMFENASGLRGETIITASIWDIILHEDKSKYTSEFDYITVPESDVELHAAMLFGNGLVFEHKSVISADLQFYYSAEMNIYKVPVSPKYFSYSPVVEKIEKKTDSEADIFKLTVGYLSPSPAWLGNDKTDILPDKYAEYTLKKENGEYIIISVSPSEYDSGRRSDI